ncbi:MAG: BamA/TamA family outer membrane protein [Ginsengibacter sp.]
MMIYLRNLCLLTFTCFIMGTALAQDTSNYKSVAAGAEYKKPKFYQWLWGKNSRKEWFTPVRVPIVNLDTLYGGLKPYQQGGGNETKSLRLTNARGQEFTMRSINKSRNDVVIPEVKGTVVEDIIQDGVSMSYPYAAFAVPLMQQYAGIPHTTPILIYVPAQQALDTFSKKFGNDLYLLEQRPDGDWSDADNLGNFKKFSSTDKIIEKLLSDDDNCADQHAFIKVRLFDILINDWDRHEDNWRWGVKDSAGKEVYTPVPRDRDQAFYTKDGVLITGIMRAADLDFMQDFSKKVEHVNMLNIEQRNMDRFFTNRMSMYDWIKAAKELQQSLTDEVITQSVRGMPSEIFDISGLELIEKLKSRRNQLTDFAKKYYLFVAKEVQIAGTKKQEQFIVNRLTTGETTVEVFRIDEQLNKKDTPFYTRTFRPKETKEIRLYGIDGEDIYTVLGKSHSMIVRIIGGPAHDSVGEYTNKRLHIYDNENNTITTSSAVKHLSNDSIVHDFNYEGYDYDINHLHPYILFNNRDRWYVGVNYTFLKHKWRRFPYASMTTIGLNYYGTTRAINASVSILYPNVFNKWDLNLTGGYNALKWTNFFGTGNETVLASANRIYHRMRSVDGSVKAGLSKHIGKSSYSISGMFQGLKIINDTSRFIAKVLRDEKEFTPNYYAALQLMYSYLTLNDSIVPTRGVTFLASTGGYRNFTQSDIFQNVTARAQGYLPLAGKFSVAIRAGGEMIIGNSSIVNNAQFNQHAIIGGPVFLRGYRAERFWGKSSFYNQNELRFITNIRSSLLNAKAGLLAFFDDGRVWLPGESSNTLHTSYGGGLMIAPFNKISASITYGISKETQVLQFVVNTLF